MMNSRDYSGFPFELREEWLISGAEPLTEEPCLVEVDIPGLTGIALKWYGVAEPQEKMGRQFFFSIFPQEIPEWEMISLSEWCVINIGKWASLKDKFPTGVWLPYEPNDWVVVIAVNHSLTDFQNRDMFGRPYFARLATRVVGSGSNVQNITPEEFTGNLKFKPIEMY